ncbi:MAG: hypothetical protein ABIP20_17855 [Chthoniobacteraceae bacterium]
MSELAEMGIARELGVSQWNLRDWKEIFGPGGAAAAVAHAVEIADVRRELEAVCRRRDILKNALAIVVREHPHASR